MRKGSLLSNLIRSVLIFLLSAPVIILLLSLQATPSIAPDRPLQASEMARLEQLFVDATPQSPTNPGVHRVVLGKDDLNLLARYGIETLNLAPDWTSNLELDDGVLHSQLSIHLVRSRLPLYLNLDAEFNVYDNRLQLSRLSAGRLQIPEALLQFALQRLRDNLAAGNQGFSDINAVLNTIQEVSINQDALRVVLDWNPELFNQVSEHAQQMLISPEDQQRIMAYYREISLLAAAIPADLGAISLNAFLTPLFRTAQANALAGSDPIAENRTLLQSLAIYVTDADIEQLLGPELAADLPKAKFVEVRLHRRQDMAQHLISMAAISASAGAGIAEMLSTTKEAYDARYRTGFSFSDLAANTAGMLLADYATRDVDSALVMQQRLANLTDESDYMPEIGNNRDGLSEDDFNALYADRNSPEYQARLAEIEQLIRARPLFQNLP